MIVVGFDPGGIKSFGWAVLEIDSLQAIIRLDTGVVSSAPDAVNAASLAAGLQPAGVGIDAPLFWTERGDRWVDSHIRKRLIAAGGSSGTVSSVNSLQGACLVQGIITARLTSKLWPTALLTEAHPKALLRISTAAEQFVGLHVPPNIQEHERDAALAAYAAWCGIVEISNWSNLALQEPNPIFPGGNVATYWFPR